jgi:3-deoxy-7-phosphoheptulonate synthase
LWIGERTRQPDGAHVEFLRGVRNPIGVKIGPNFNGDDVLRLLQRLNPDNIGGRVSLITRFGARQADVELPRLIALINQSGCDVVWICDPMHGNTIATTSNRKTRRLTDILEELDTFFAVHSDMGTQAGGIHLELTGERVTECLGGSRDISEESLMENYETLCDPRLNSEQSLELAFEIASILERR